jgi:hypothetical protein
MQNFMLQSLRQPPEAKIELDLNELELAASPSLSSLTIRYFDLDEEGFANYNEQAVMEMVAGGAPNLREVHMFREASANSPWLLLAWRKQRQPWRREKIFPAMPTGIQGSLKTIEIVAKDSTKFLMRWSEATDFSKLQSLMVHSQVDTEVLLWLTNSCQFSALDTLALYLDSVASEEPFDYLSDAIDGLLLCLRPFENLKLVGIFESRTISLALSHHGHHLRRLLLSSTEPLSETHLKQGRADFATVPLLHEMRQSCPVLEEISLCIFRSKGDTSEVAIYQAIGQISSLRKVHLAILCPQPFTWDRVSCQGFADLCDGSQEMDANTSYVLENALINLAMDEVLAHSIFRVISTAKPLNARPLECLELRIDALQDCGGFTTSSLVDILRYIARAWICNRSLRDDEPHKCYVKEYDAQEISEREEAEQWNELPLLEELQYAQALCRVWPRCREGDWKPEWHSFALVEK